MILDPYCMCCQINRQEKKIRPFADEEKKIEYMKQVLYRFSQTTQKDCAPSISVEMSHFFSEFWGIPMEDYSHIKREFNQLMLDCLPQFRSRIEASKDPLESALIYSRIGNYIDFAALANVEKDTLFAMFEASRRELLDPREYTIFRKELAKAGSLVYLADNCGEIVLDRLVLEVLKDAYPNLSVTFVVRGAQVHNDATVEDAEMCGITDLVPVIGNGSNVGGTWLSDISKETLSLLQNADLIISKGQGNFETLHGCGLNIYYLFLCKCDKFVNMFKAQPLQGMFVNETRL